MVVGTAGLGLSLPLNRKGRLSCLFQYGCRSSCSAPCLRLAGVLTTANAMVSKYESDYTAYASALQLQKSVRDAETEFSGKFTANIAVVNAPALMVGLVSNEFLFDDSDDDEPFLVNDVDDDSDDESSSLPMSHRRTITSLVCSF